MGIWDWLRGRAPTGTTAKPEARAAGGKTPSEVRWLPAEESPFGFRTLDIRPTTAGMLSTTTDPALATRAISWTTATVEALPALSFGADAVTLPCSLSYPVAASFPDGMLFAPRAMEEKWVLFHRGGSLHAVRSWTGDVVAVARGARDGDRLMLAELTVKPAGLGPLGDPVPMFDWLVRSHALGQQLPMPVSEAELEMIAEVPLMTFSAFGVKAEFAATTWAPPEPVWPLRVHGEIAQAVRRGDTAAIRALLARGADPNVPSPIGGYMALHIAVVRGDADATRALLAGGANPRARTDRAMDPVGIGIANRAPIALLEELIAAGAGTDAVNTDGFGLLHAAAETDRPEIVAWLAPRGLDLEARTARGLTPLHIACGLGHADAARALVAAGADATAASPMGTPRAIATAEGHAALAATLPAARA